MSNKKVTAEDVVRWLWDADHWQAQIVADIAKSIAAARHAEHCLLDTEDEPF